MGSKIQDSPSSPSFNSYSSSSATLADIAARVIREVGHVSESYEVDLKEEEEEEQKSAVDDEEEFEFCFVEREPDVTADDMFDNGQIRPLYYYPVFDTSLLLEPPATAVKRMPLGKLFLRERSSSSSSSSSSEELELGVESGTYCLWNPNERKTATKAAAASSSSSRPKMSKKSNSTGSVSKRWKLRDLLLNRSNSEGKEQGNGGDGESASTYHVVLFHPNPQGKEKATGGEAGRPVVQGLGVKERSSYSPYRQEDMVGFFSNVNGLSRNLHPF